MLKALKWFGWAALLLLALGGALAIDWSSYFADDEPLEPGQFYGINPDLVTGVVFSASDLKLFAYRWKLEGNFRIVVVRPGRSEVEQCEAGEGFVRWFTMATKLPIGPKLDRPLDSGSGDWAVLELVTDTVLEGVETRLRLPSAPGEPIIFQFGLDQYPVDWNPEAFGIVKSGCAGLGAKP